MKVQAVTPVESASDPKHPDHDRWVKETTLKMEVEHAKRVGLSLRDAETENAHWLQRAEALAREAKPAAPAPSKEQRKRKTREERLAERPVERRVAKGPPRTWKNTSPCGRCGTCRGCKREKRIYAIAVAARRDGDQVYKEALNTLWLHSMSAQNLTGTYAGMTKRDALRRLVRRMEDLCDSTIMQMGPWR